MAAPAERPKLGRPAAVTSSSGDGPTTTEGRSQETTPSNQLTTPSNRFLPSKQLPKPTAQLQNKQAAGQHIEGGKTATRADGNHATSNFSDRVPPFPADSGLNGPPPVKAFTSAAGSRPTRSTRNPNPCYVDSIAFDVTPWSASQAQIQELNLSINRRTSRSP